MACERRVVWLGVPTLLWVKSVLLALVGAVVSVLAFPPYGPGGLIFFGICLFLMSIRDVESRKQGLLVSAIYGVVFFGGLMWWLAELELIALILVPLQAAFLAAYGWWLARYNERSSGVWLTLAVGGWAVMELIRYHYPVGGLEWGAAGYALSDHAWTRFPAAWVGVSGLTLLVVLIAALLAQIGTRNFGGGAMIGGPAVLLLIAGAFVLVPLSPRTLAAQPFSVVQGSTPCPFEHCPPNERLRTYQQHLTLTKRIRADEVGLVVWAEGSTGSFNADPVRNDEIGAAIGAEAERIGAWFVVGSDRPVSDTEWINTNVIFDSDGNYVGEYRKQHPVPFGEYIPLRPLFDWIPALDRVPRDMIPGGGPAVFELPGYVLGSVISFEGGFSRYTLETRRAGAQVIVVTTNEASYGPDAATSDQFIGMTRMRAVELGVPIIHAAVTGKSTVIGPDGDVGDTTALGAQEVLSSSFGGASDTPFTVIGNSIMYLAALLCLLTWWRSKLLVGSDDHILEEE